MLTALCNDPITLAFFRRRVPRRQAPLTKALLQRIDLGAILSRADRPALRARACDIQERDLGARGSEAIAEAIAYLEQQWHTQEGPL